MSALVSTPGPIHLWARFRSNPIAAYLGTAVTAPEPEHDFAYLPVMNDIGGRSKAFQLIQDGEDAIVTMVLNRFDLNVCRGIRALHSAAGGGAITGLGSETPFARGSLVIGVSDFELVVVNKYAGTPAAGNSDLQVGRRYVSAHLEKYKESTVGNRVLEVAMIVKCENGYVVTGPLAGGFQLYTETDLGPLAPIT
jgi:hypothetical protein